MLVEERLVLRDFGRAMKRVRPVAASWSLSLLGMRVVVGTEALEDNTEDSGDDASGLLAEVTLGVFVILGSALEVQSDMSKSQFVIELLTASESSLRLCRRCKRLGLFLTQ